METRGTGHLWAVCRSGCDHREYPAGLASQQVVWEPLVFMDGSLGMLQLKDLAAGETRRSRLSASKTAGVYWEHHVCAFERWFCTSPWTWLWLRGLTHPIASWGDWDPGVTSTQLAAVFEPCDGDWYTEHVCVYRYPNEDMCMCNLYTDISVCLFSTGYNAQPHYSLDLGTWRPNILISSRSPDYQLLRVYSSNFCLWKIIP